MTVRLLIVQYAGDYRETMQRLASGQEETYYAQKYSDLAVERLVPQCEEVATLCCLSEEPYNEVLANGVRAIGAGFLKSGFQMKELFRLIEAYQPTHLVIRTPLRDLIRWVTRHPVRAIATFADSFKPQGLKSRFWNFQVSRYLNHPHIEWVGNHGLPAARSLAEIGVKADKIIPWDWPHQVTPAQFATKPFPTDKPIWDLFYVGMVTEAKGVNDVLHAIATLRQQGRPIRLQVAGKVDLDVYQPLVRSLGIEEQVEFLGLVANSTIVPRMREADLVVVPSRHEYPEGFPMSIYEALTSRTPIIASDHPMFLQALAHQQNALIFPAGDVASLAQHIEQLLASPTLYQQLSQASAQAWYDLQLPVKWADLMTTWVADSATDRQWLWKHRLASGLYSGDNDNQLSPQPYPHIDLRSAGGCQP